MLYFLLLYNYGKNRSTKKRKEVFKSHWQYRQGFSPKKGKA